MKKPFMTLSSDTWESLFPDENKAINDEQQWDPVSPQRFYLAHHFQTWITLYKEELCMSTVVIIEPN